jgi:hypothetical protein
MTSGVPRKVAHLWHKDWLTVFRDRMLLLLLVVPPFAGLALRIMVLLAARFWPAAPPELASLVAPFVAQMPAMMIGYIAGLGLVAERERRTAVALAVMPLPYHLYVLYQAGWPSLAAFVMTWPGLALFGVTPASWGLTVAAVMAAALSAGVVSFLLGGLASNRIEALAVSKGLNLVIQAPLVALFVLPPAGQALLAWNPWYWLYLALLEAIGGRAATASPVVRWPGYPAALAVAACIATAALWIWALARWYRQRAAL